MKNKNMLQVMSLSCLSIPVLASCGTAVHDGRPNILFFIMDDASFNHFSAAGCRWTDTPAFDRVADDGIFFSNCYTPNAKSAPSRAVLLTGRYSWQLEDAGNHITNFPPDIKVFTETLSENGYTVGCTGKGWAPGNPGIVDGKPRQLTGKPYQTRKLQPPTRFISNIDYAANFSDFLDDAADGPWFFWAGTREPHRKYEYGSGVSIGGKKPEQIDSVPAYWPDNEIVRNDMLDYSFEIEHADAHLMRMIEELESRNELENTVIIVTADNGMPFPRAKANNYEQSHHQPLAIMWKKGIRNPGRKVSDYINFTDIAPTILDLAGIPEKTSGMLEMSGKSIKKILSRRKSGQVIRERDHLIFGRERDDYGRPGNQGYPIRGIIADGLLYIWNIKPWLYPACDPETGYCEIDGSPVKTQILNMWRSGADSTFYELSMGKRPEEELYDLTADKDCIENLAEIPEYRDIKESMRKRLMEILRRQGDPRVTGNGDIFDHYPYSDHEYENFYEKTVSGEIQDPWSYTDWIEPTDYDEYVRKLEAGEIKPAPEFTSGINW